MLIACAFYFHGKPFDFKSAIISDLESPEENPSGYGASAAGTAIGMARCFCFWFGFVRRTRSFTTSD
jgi:hypothetical protein